MIIKSRNIIVSIMTGVVAILTSCILYVFFESVYQHFGYSIMMHPSTLKYAFTNNSEGVKLSIFMFFVLIFPMLYLNYSLFVRFIACFYELKLEDNEFFHSCLLKKQEYLYTDIQEIFLMDVPTMTAKYERMDVIKIKFFNKKIIRIALDYISKDEKDYILKTLQEKTNINIIHKKSFLV